MALLIPNSYGSAVDGRVIREFNPHHEPKGSAKGGQFARAPGGSASSGTGTPGKKVKKLEISSYSSQKFDPELARKILGKEPTPGNFEALAEDMLRDVEGVNFSVEVATLRPGAFGPADKLMLKFTGDDATGDSSPTSLIRTFSRNADGELVVKHSSFEKNRNLPPGFGKDMLRSHMQAYERLGVKRIDTVANIDIGAYAWAKYGFVSSDPQSLGTDLETLATDWHGRMVGERNFETGDMTGKMVAVDDHVVNEMYRIAASPSPTKIWEWVDMTVQGVKVGKALITDGNQGWPAHLNVTGTDRLSVMQRERFWNYVGRTKAPKPVGRPPKAREAMVIVYEAEPRGSKTPGELCEWDGRRYDDRRIWPVMLNGDRDYFYDLLDAPSRAAYRAALPRG